LAEAGLEVVLGTPTAAPPAWLVEQHPEILPVDIDGQLHRFGNRRQRSSRADDGLAQRIK